MRIRKPVKIDDREFVVRELTVKEIINLFQNATNNATNLVDTDAAGLEFFKGEIGRFVELALEGKHKVEEFYEMAPSELNTLYDTFKEVNEVFFRIARSVGIEKILDELKQSILKDFSSLVVGSSKRVTLKHLTTDIPTSLPQ